MDRGKKSYYYGKRGSGEKYGSRDHMAPGLQASSEDWGIQGKENEKQDHKLNQIIYR